MKSADPWALMVATPTGIHGAHGAHGRMRSGPNRSVAVAHGGRAPVAGGIGVCRICMNQ